MQKHLDVLVIACSHHSRSQMHDIGALHGILRARMHRFVFKPYPKASVRKQFARVLLSQFHMRLPRKRMGILQVDLCFLSRETPSPERFPFSSDRQPKESSLGILDCTTVIHLLPAWTGSGNSRRPAASEPSGSAGRRAERSACRARLPPGCVPRPPPPRCRSA